MPTGARFLLTLAIVLAAILGLSLCGYQNWERTDQSSLIDYMLASAETKPELCMDEQTREELRAVMLDALSEAFKTHVAHTYEVWLRDSTGQPERARRGVELGVRSYLSARKGAIDWAPPPCAG